MSELGDLMRAEDWRLECENLQKHYNKLQEKLETERQEHAEALDKFLDINEKLHIEQERAEELQAVLDACVMTNDGNDTRPGQNKGCPVFALRADLAAERQARERAEEIVAAQGSRAGLAKAYVARMHERNEANNAAIAREEARAEATEAERDELRAEVKRLRRVKLRELLDMPDGLLATAHAPSRKGKIG